MDITPDTIVVGTFDNIQLNATIVITWGVMVLLVLIAWFFSRRVVKGALSNDVKTFLELVVEFLYGHLEDIGLKEPEKYVGFIGTFFIFIAFCGVLTIVPGYIPPTSSLSTTAGLAIAVFFSGPVYAIRKKGFVGFLKNYLHPVFVFLPFNIIADVSRSFALAIRLFGNTMSGAVVIGLIVSIMPLLFPVILHVLDLITSMVQAYIFTVLATVYIAGATRTFSKEE